MLVLLGAFCLLVASLIALGASRPLQFRHAHEYECGTLPPHSGAREACVERYVRAHGSGAPVRWLALAGVSGLAAAGLLVWAAWRAESSRGADPPGLADRGRVA